MKGKWWFNYKPPPHRGFYWNPSIARVLWELGTYWKNMSDYASYIEKRYSFNKKTYKDL